MLVSAVLGDVYRLCVSPTSSLFSPSPPRDLQHPGLSWCWAALPALVGEGAGDLTLLPVSCSRCQLGAAAALVTTQIPGSLPSQYNLLTVYFSMSSAIFGLQTSYKLGFHWLFTLFLRRSARCSSWHRENWALLPPTSLPFSLFLPTHSSDIVEKKYF